jgi:hypothetical protein
MLTGFFPTDVHGSLVFGGTDSTKYLATNGLHKNLSAAIDFADSESGPHQVQECHRRCRRRKHRSAENHGYLNFVIGVSFRAASTY